MALSDLPMTESFESALWADDFSVADYALETSAIVTARQKRLLVPIEEVPLGARVPTKNPKPWEVDESLPEPDQETWAKVSFTVERPDGAVIDAELIRPLEWIRANGIQVGHLLPLNIAELQVTGVALVTAIEACPMIACGQGSVVTGRFMTRRVDVIIRAEILGNDGTVELLEGTAIHPIWSVDRKDWVPLGEIADGERLQAADGIATVVSLLFIRVAVPVYNVEVLGEHVYAVGLLSILVHNTGECLVRFGQAAETAQQLADDAARAVANGFPHGISTKLVARVTGSDKLHKSVHLALSWVQF